MYVVVISRSRMDLYAELSRDFKDDPLVKIVLDRRVTERGRRTARRPPSGERRRRDRRVVEDQPRDLETFGYVLVRTDST
jgi:hypothetical protein